MEREKDGTRSLAQGSGATPESTASLFFGKPESVPKRLNVGESSDTQLICPHPGQAQPIRRTTPIRIMMMNGLAGSPPLDRLTLLFLAQAILAACGGGGGGGGPDTGGPPSPDTGGTPSPDTGGTPTPDPGLPAGGPPAPESDPEPEAEVEIPDPDWANTDHRETTSSKSLLVKAALKQAEDPQRYNLDLALQTESNRTEGGARRNDNDLLQPAQRRQRRDTDQPPDDAPDETLPDETLPDENLPGEDSTGSVSRVFVFRDGEFDFESDRVRDRGNVPHFLIEVRAEAKTDEDSDQPLVETKLFKIRIVNIDEHAPEFITGDEITRAEVTGESDVSFTVTATDADHGDVVSYSLSDTGEDEDEDGDNHNSLVTINPVTGDITFADGAFNFEQAESAEGGRRFFLIDIIARSNAKNSPAELTEARQSLKIWVTDVDEAPTGFALEDAVSSLAETVDTGTRIKVADLVVTDPDTKAAFRRHSFSLSGTHADMFEVEDGVLYLKAGAVLDHESASELPVTVTVDGPVDGTALRVDHRITVLNRLDEAVWVTSPGPLSVAETAARNAVIGRLAARPRRAG